MKRRTAVNAGTQELRPRRTTRTTMVRVIFDTIRKQRLYLYSGKDGAHKVVNEVRSRFPGATFNVMQYPWYLSRFRRQRSLGLPVDRVVRIAAFA